MGMFSNENTTTFGGTIGNVNKAQNGCLKFGICQEYPTMVDGVPTKAANWLNVLLSEKQSKAFAAKIKRGDEITVEGELRITQYNGHPSITLFVKKIVKIRPGEHRALVGLYYAYMNNSEMLDMITNQDLMKGVLENTLRAFQQRGGVPQKGQNVQSAQPQSNQSMPTAQAQPAASQPASQPVQSQSAQHQSQPQTVSQPVVNEQPVSQPASQQVQSQQVHSQPVQTQSEVQTTSQPVVNDQPVSQPASQPVETKPVHSQPVQQPEAQMTTQAASIPQEIIEAAMTQSNEDGSFQEPDWLNNDMNPQDVLQDIAGAVANAAVGEHNFYTHN
ncbi:hypothetical protein [Vibrio alginolyticus]|uniref:hypothetical protein n=1 Tax=Vibrio alginolyticus TaxID=663 RepID=UPI0022AB2A70|nr:hypothetical protein [Vibrio alginolyticus]